MFLVIVGASFVVTAAAIGFTHWFVGVPRKPRPTPKSQVSRTVPAAR
jgi:hypothetical protein